MKDEYLQRTIGLIGKEDYETISHLLVALIGLGGVGGTALESLVRSGIKHLLIIDFDKVDPSNLNRQILYTEKDIGHSKVECAKKHVLAIDSSIDVTAIEAKVDSDISNILNQYHIDFIVDAIDDVDGKIYIAKYASDNNIPSIMSLGMANRLDPTKVIIQRLDKTEYDPLAKKMRYLARLNNLNSKNIMTVLSLERPKSFNGTLNSMMMVPSSAGLAITNYVISYFINKNKNI